MFDKVLIANRGEIALRIMRSAHALGIDTVAVFSDADRHAPHVAMASRAVHIGPSPAPRSYLDIAGIIGAARRSGAEAIHPGYGFLSENAAFAAACAEAGLTFIGPSADVIRLMGSKREAKALMADHGVPVVPGYFGDADDAALADEAARIGFPVLIKASAGGGGRGMRLVREARAFPGALQAARREALGAFGDDTILLEKYIERPRHVEVQIFGDHHGHCVHLFERDCSVQRRYQKLIEEAPANHLGAAQREQILSAAVTAGRAAGYVGAGTVEFVVDTDGGIYFIEMNTRLQVEHPVTEMITGEDLVAWQFRVAAGEALPAQADIAARGHAIELRVCAEDTERDFAPATGLITHFGLPEGVRVDHGVGASVVISPFYDSMIAKIIVHGRDRGEAMHKARAALRETRIGGITTNRGFLARILEHPDFIADALDTHFIERRHAELTAAAAPATVQLLAVAALYIVSVRVADAPLAADPGSPWGAADSFRLNVVHEERLTLIDGDDVHAVSIARAAHGYTVACDGQRLEAYVESLSGTRLGVLVDGERLSAECAPAADGELDVFAAGRHVRLRVVDPLHSADESDAASGGLAAPMPGTVLEVFVEAGQQISAGAPIMLLEAMKIEHTITAPFDGTVTELRFKAGDQVAAEGIALAVMEPAAS